MEFNKTQLSNVIQQIKTAVASHTPIVYIPTNQVELLQEILYNPSCTNSIVPRLVAVGTEGNVMLVNDAESCSQDKMGVNDNYIPRKTELSFNVTAKSSEIYSLYHCPLLLYCYVENFDSIKTALFSFICSYQGLKVGTSPLDRRILDNIRRSVWIVITPQQETIPANISPYVKTIDVPALQDEEIIDIVNKKLDENGIDRGLIDNDFSNQMKVSLRGLSARTIANIISQLITTQVIDYDMVRKGDVLEVIRAEKKQMLSDSTGLRWESVKATNAAGLEAISNWLEERQGIFEDPETALKNHIDIPKGILVSGIPGSGKSLMAKTAAHKLRLPLISLDMGALLGGIMGQSEHNMINALNMADKMAPCVLWIDEIEKAFSGSSKHSSSSDGGVGRRMFGKFLTWMQEKSSSCFVFATSNDISCLPPELFRSERFDMKYFTFMPMAEDCAKIFAANIKGQNKKYQYELEDKSDDEKKSMPGILFSEELTDAATWLEILNECCTSDFDSCSLVKMKSENDEVYKWKTGKRPVNKLFTGADIAAIIKEAKFIVSKKNKENITCIYAKDDFLDAIREVIMNFQPYGETNLHDIVKCFRSLYENRFKSAATKCVVDFSHYDNDERIYEMTEDELEKFDNRYDQVLFSTVVGAINYSSFAS